MTPPDLVQLKTEDFDLLELTNTGDDEMLAKYLDQNDMLLKEHFQNNPVSTQSTITNKTAITSTETSNVTNVQHFGPPMPILPKMYFPNSYVTINYNFGK